MVGESKRHYLRAQSDCHALTIRKRPARRDLRGHLRTVVANQSFVIDNDNDIRDGDAHPAIRQSIVPRTTQSCLPVRGREGGSAYRDTDYYDQPGTRRAPAHEIHTE